MKQHPTGAWRTRRSTRLKGFDYAEEGAYFVTICTYHGAPFLGAIQDGRMCPADAGVIVESTWHALPLKFPMVRGRAFQLMPNHLHGILEIRHSVGISRLSYDARSVGDRVTLSRIVAFFKYEATRRLNKQFGTPGHQRFQRGFYDRIIRGDREHFFIERYMELNPLL